MLGAGASRGSGDYGSELPPPLTVDLFDETLYREYLSIYDLAHQAGRFIAQARKEDDALGLEHALHRLRVSEHAHHRHMALAVPPYLQHLLYTVSETHYTEAFRYDHLIERLLRLPYVCFLTLNYDLLLDRRLNGHHRLSTLDDYISRDKNWSLIKLHGSVNWLHDANQTFSINAPPKDLAWDAETYECIAPDVPLSTVRGTSLATKRYPALAMPEGPDDRLVLPTKHLWFLRSMLKGKEVDLLSIGYSGLDNEALKLIESLECKVRRMTIVDQDLYRATEVFTRFENAGIRPLWPDIANYDFAGWIDDGGLARLVDEYDGPYSR
jgi:hypothetical protein